VATRIIDVASVVKWVRFAPTLRMTGPGARKNRALVEAPVAELVAVTVTVNSAPVGVGAVQDAAELHCDGSRPMLAGVTPTGAAPKDEVHV
jgi:hypothetical protein